MTSSRFFWRASDRVPGRVERVARAIDPVAWAWIDRTRQTNPQHIALAMTRDRLMQAAKRAIAAM